MSDYIASNERFAWPARVVGSIIASIGLTLALGGAWLTALGGSGYYLIVGLAMIGSGVLLVQRQMSGGWLFVGIVAATVMWAVWEVGSSPWALVPRLVAPILLLLVVIAVMPLLTPAAGAWRWAGVAGAGVLVATAGGFALAAHLKPHPVRSNLPPLAAAAMPDPALMAAGADWPAYGGTYSARRYSPLDQITPANVGDLERVWLARTGDMPSEAARNKYAAETTPLKIGDSLYLCSAKNILISLNPSTGRERWRFDPKVGDEHIPYTAACRGVAYYVVPDANSAMPCATRIIEGTLDARLIAVDARTGRLCAGFGVNGQVDTTTGMGAILPSYAAITSPPTIVRGVVVTGRSILDGQTRSAPSGVIRGYDAVTGALRWSWDMTHPEWALMPPAGREFTRGTPNMWTIASGDEALGLVYLPMGNTAADYWSEGRTEAGNLFDVSLVALDVGTGRPRWSFKAVKKDVWDYDLSSQATLIDYPTAAGPVPALVLTGKQGDIFVLDRRTGRPLTPIATMRAPTGGAEPEMRSPTQILSRWHTLRQADLTEKKMWGMSPVDQLFCRIQFRRSSYDGFYTPPTAGRRSIQYPANNGGSDWGGVAVDPRRGVIVANYNDTANHVRLVPRDTADARGWKMRGQSVGPRAGGEGTGGPQMGTPYAVSVNTGWRVPFTGLLCTEPPYGGIRAIDIATGKTIWDRPLGTARNNGPFGIASDLPFHIGTPNNGGAVVTAGGLVFIAAATDGLIRAIDLRSGVTVWKDVLPAGGQATPMTYSAGGRQYVVIMTGGHHFMETKIGDQVVAYALPRGATKRLARTASSSPRV